MTNPLLIPLTREGTISFRVVPSTQLMLEVVGRTMSLPQLAFELSGTSVELPDNTTLQVKTTVTRPPFSPVEVASSAILRVKEFEHGRPCGCTATLSFDLIALGAIGTKADLKIEIFPQFPHAGPVVLREGLALECGVDSDLLERPSNMGRRVEFRRRAIPEFDGTWLRLSIEETDMVAGEAEGAGFAPRPVTSVDWARGGDLAQTLQHWHVGCAGASARLAYLQTEEVGDYEFAFRLDASFDQGKNWYPLPCDFPTLTVPRPKLAQFALRRHPGAADVDLLIRVEGFDADFDLDVDVRLWTHGVRDPLTMMPLRMHGAAHLAQIAGVRDFGLHRGSLLYATLELSADSSGHAGAIANHWLDYSGFAGDKGDILHDTQVRSAELEVEGELHHVSEVIALIADIERLVPTASASHVLEFCVSATGFYSILFDLLVSGDIADGGATSVGRLEGASAAALRFRGDLAQDATTAAGRLPGGATGAEAQGLLGCYGELNRLTRRSASARDTGQGNVCDDSGVLLTFSHVLTGMIGYDRGLTDSVPYIFTLGGDLEQEARVAVDGSRRPDVSSDGELTPAELFADLDGLLIGFAPAVPLSEQLTSYYRDRFAHRYAAARREHEHMRRSVSAADRLVMVRSEWSVAAGADREVAAEQVVAVLAAIGELRNAVERVAREHAGG